MHRLAFTPLQFNKVAQLYNLKQEMSLAFSTSVEDQRDVQEFLKLHGLDRAARARLESQWNVQWSNGWTVGKESDTRQRILLQWYVLTVF